MAISAMKRDVELGGTEHGGTDLVSSRDGAGIWT